MKDYARIATKIQETPWLMTKPALGVILGIFEEHRFGSLTDEQIQQRLASVEYMGRNKLSAGDTPSGAGQVVNGVGILQLFGPIFGKANLMTQMSGATSLDTFKNEFRAMMNDPMVSSILLQVDSPGGSSEMVQEMSDEIFAARKNKPIYAIADNTTGSAAYYIASQADAIYATPSGSVGSIGVYTVHEDHSVADAQQGVKYTYISAGPHKTEGNPHEPLSAEAKAHTQEVVDEIYGQFLGAVARGRNVSTEQVQQNFGGGRMFSATKALEAGMIDGIMPFEQLVNALASQPKQVSVSVPATAAKAMLNALAANHDVEGFILHGNYSDGTVKLESREWEHSEPGTGPTPAIGDQEQPDPGVGQPVPRQTGDPIRDDKAIAGGWRRDGELPLDPSDPGAPQATATNAYPKYDLDFAARMRGDRNLVFTNTITTNNTNTGREEDTSYMNENIARLRTLFGLSADTTDDAVMSAVEAQITELNALKAATSMASEEQRLATEFPAMYKQHQEMLERDRSTSASAFAQSVSKFKIATEGGEFKDTTRGLSSLACETVAEAHKKFAMGTGGLEDFEAAITAIAHGGTLEFGEAGHSVEGELPVIDLNSNAGISNTRKLFAQKVAEIKDKDSLDLSAAMKVAAERYPDLAEAYAAAVPA